MIFWEIKKSIQLILRNWSCENVKFDLWVSKDASRAHFISNVSHLLAKKQNLSSTEVGNKLIILLLKDKINKKLKKIVLNNGFLNFFVKTSFFNQIISQILSEQEKFGRLNFGQQKTVHYEWVSANPTGYLHLGHARNVFVGQAITNILDFAGYKVIREFYINDHGNQVYQLGKSVYYHYQKLLGEDALEFEQLYQNKEIVDVAEKIVKEFGNRYQNKVFDQNLDLQKFFIAFATKFFLTRMQEDLLNWGVQFDVWFSEKNLYQENQFDHFIKRLKDKELVYIKDGALWFCAKKGGYDQDFVLIKSNQLPTYFAGDIMYHDDKFRRGYDRYIDLFGADHHSHYLKIKAGLRGLGWDVSRFCVDLLQMVKIVHGGENLKISKRRGTSFPLTELVEMVGLDFLKFVLLSRQKETKFVFNLNLIKEKNAQNPFFYVQYAYARSCQLISKTKFVNNSQDLNYLELTSLFEENLLLYLYEFPIMVQQAVVIREPQILVNYALKLCKNFHVLYENIVILNAKEETQKQKIALIKAFQQVLLNNLRLLGITVQTKM